MGDKCTKFYSSINSKYLDGVVSSDPSVISNYIINFIRVYIQNNSLGDSSWINFHLLLLRTLMLGGWKDPLRRASCGVF